MRNICLKNILFLLIVALFVFVGSNSIVSAEESVKFESGKIQADIFDSIILTGKVYILVGGRGKIYRSVDGGQYWTIIQSNTTEQLFSICFPDAINGWIVGSSGIILHSSDGGESWSVQSNVNKKNLFSIYFSDPLHGCAVGDWGVVVRTEDGGTTWQDVSLPKDVILYGVQFADCEHGLMVGEFGQIFSTQDGGRTWEGVSTTATDQTLFCINMDMNNKISVAAGLGGIIVYSLDRGKTWIKAQSNSTAAIYGITICGDQAWAVGNKGTVLHSIDSGRSWKREKTSEEIKHSWFCTVSYTCSNKHVGFMAGAHGLLYRITGQKLIW
ncbi:MAG: WD40/YVTN/BNR-like repeat-containing protein [Dissulfuribacterales bacterium]